MHVDGPEYPILLAVDQELGKVAALWVAPKRPNRVGPLEVGSIRTWSQLGRATAYEANLTTRTKNATKNATTAPMRATDQTSSSSSV